MQFISGISTLLVACLWLDPSDNGLMAMAGIWTASIAMMGEMGLSAAIMQFRDLVDEELNARFWLMLVIGTTEYVVLFISAPYIALWFERSRLSSILRIAGITLPLISLRVVPDRLLRKRVAFDEISKVQLFVAIVTILTMVGAAASGAGVWALVMGSMIQAVAGTFLFPCVRRNGLQRTLFSNF